MPKNKKNLAINSGENDRLLQEVVVEGNNNNTNKEINPVLISSKKSLLKNTIDSLKERKQRLEQINKENEEAIPEIKKAIIALKAVKPTFIKRHPYVILEFLLLSMMLTLEVYLIINIKEHNDEVEENALNQFENTLVPDTNTTCGEIESLSSVCNDNDDSGGGILAYTAKEYCDSLLNSLCYSVNSKESTPAFWISIINAILIMITAIGLCIYMGFSKNKFIKDDRRLENISDEQKQIIKNIKDKHTVWPSEDVHVYDVIESCKEIISCLENEIVKNKEEIKKLEDKIKENMPYYEASSKYVTKFLYFFAEKDHPENGPLTKIPRDIKKEIYMYIDPTKDREEIFRELKI